METERQWQQMSGTTWECKFTQITSLTHSACCRVNSMFCWQRSAVLEPWRSWKCCTKANLPQTLRGFLWSDEKWKLIRWPWTYYKTPFLFLSFLLSNSDQVLQWKKKMLASIIANFLSVMHMLTSTSHLHTPCHFHVLNNSSSNLPMQTHPVTTLAWQRAPTRKVSRYIYSHTRHTYTHKLRVTVDCMHTHTIVPVYFLELSSCEEGWKRFLCCMEEISVLWRVQRVWRV